MGSSLLGPVTMSVLAPEETVTTFVTMRKEAPKAGEDWFRIEAKKDDVVKVYIYDEIGMWGTSAKDFAAQLDAIDAKEVHLHVNSPGGSVFDGLAIHSSIQGHKAKTIAKVDGLAASAASFIIQAADEREMGRNAQVMIHDARAFAGGNAAAMLKASQLLDQLSDNIADMYAQRGTETAQQFRTRMKAEEWYNGTEARDLGLVDRVTNEKDEDAEKAKDKWDLEAMFRYTGQTAPAPAALLNSIAINPKLKEQEVMDPVTTPPTPAQPPVAVVPPVPAPVAFDAVAADAAYPAVARFRTGEQYDMAAVHAHVKGLETFKTETIENGRKDFVAKLATDNKIAATAITETEAFALTLSDEQFTAWKKSMDSAQPNSLFAQHGTTVGDPTAPNSSPASALDAEIETYQGIVDGHRAGGMSEESLKTKDSYKQLQALLEQKNKLQS